MAWITNLNLNDGIGKIQPTQVTAQVKVFRSENDAPIVQIDTHGSADRLMPGKKSQTIQFGEEVAADLYLLLKRTYGFK